MTDIREQEMQGKIDELTAQKASLEAENKQLRKAQVDIQRLYLPVLV